MLVLPAQFLDYKFKLGITLHAAAVVFSNVNQRRKMAFYYNLYLLYCLLFWLMPMMLIYWGEAYIR